MRVGDRHRRAIWLADDGWTVQVIDQTLLPHRFEVMRLATCEDARRAIATMVVRGAPLIGATAAYGMALAARADGSDAHLSAASASLLAARPTAVNLRWAVERVHRAIRHLPVSDRGAAAYLEAALIADEDVAANTRLGSYALDVLRDVASRARQRPRTIAGAAAEHGQRPLQILTHCNAGWLATVDYGTALSGIYQAHDAGMPVHVWVDETRPRNQGAALTAWELGQHGVPHTIVVDNAGGHLMQRGDVDLCIVGTDRTTASGDVVNKIGTYLKALAAYDNGIPFYVALPSSTIDWSTASGRDVVIEERDGSEVALVRGMGPDGATEVAIGPPGSAVANPAFDVTPARLVTALITERGVCAASAAGLLSLFPERSAA